MSQAIAVFCDWEIGTETCDEQYHTDQHAREDWLDLNGNDYCPQHKPFVCPSCGEAKEAGKPLCDDCQEGEES